MKKKIIIWSIIAIAIAAVGYWIYKEFKTINDLGKIGTSPEPEEDLLVEDVDSGNSFVVRPQPVVSTNPPVEVEYINSHNYSK